MASERQYSPVDRLLLQADAALRTLLPFSGASSRPSPAIVQNETELSGDDAVRMQKLLDALEDLDDVQEVYTSAVLDA